MVLYQYKYMLVLCISLYGELSRKNVIYNVYVFKNVGQT